ncbi:MAG: efflux RND transporter periplasmic adaptor subunit [Alphaproteobacteria bacterium]
MVKRLLLLLTVIGLAIAAYLIIVRWPETEAPAQAVPAPPPEVGIVTVQPAEVPFPITYAGRVVGFRDVEVRALVGGILQQRGFEEGARVEQGQLLFQIDPATYQVALDRAEAQLQQANATLREAETSFARTEALFRRGVATERARDEALAARDQALAAVQLAEAGIASARLDLGYTRVNAPVSGVTAVQSPAIGTLIQAEQTLLTTITPLDPAYVNFSFTDEEGRAFRELNERRARPIDETDLAVDLQFGNGALYPHPGRIDTAAQRVDPQTGTIQARAIFPNPEGELLPGQFVRVRIRGVTLPDAIVVPKRAISQGPQGPSVFVVGANDIAEARPVRLGAELPEGWAVRDGLEGGERVVVDGVIRVRAGAPVRPTTAPAGAPEPAPSDTSRLGAGR